MSDDDQQASPVQQAAADAVARSGRNSAVQNISVDLTAVLGTADMKVANLLKIGRGAVIELDRRVGDTVEVRCNGMPVGRGEVVVVEDHLAVSITEMYTSSNQSD
jgi:flagellar motor switch protein FliN/FliY